MKKIVPVIVVVLIALLVWLFYPHTPPRPALRLYAGAGLRRAVEKLVVQFKTETGIMVEPDYGGSGMIISRARDDSDADLFMPGDVWYVDRLDELTAGRVAERATAAYFVPTIIVAKGNPKNVHELTDLIRPDLRLGLGRADACQIGRTSQKILQNAGIDTTTLKPQESLTVNELGVWVKMKTVDAAIVWDAIAANIAGDVDTITIPPEQNVVSHVVLARLNGSRDPDAAARFLAFVTGPTGRDILQNTGYRVEPPDEH